MFAILAGLGLPSRRTPLLLLNHQTSPVSTGYTLTYASSPLNSPRYPPYRNHTHTSVLQGFSPVAGGL
ncbi:hypothetical protein JB92DRAFT_2847747 [Gautieria morchelliformis]|nr:hypothetical protein JB92DRAFT_2847747 [Gautieria morchelliformis]